MTFGWVSEFPTGSLSTVPIARATAQTCEVPVTPVTPVTPIVPVAVEVAPRFTG